MAERTLSPLARCLRALVRLYQLTLSPIIGPVCRYDPSCSHYAVTALETHGGFRGSWLTLRRLARCHPWGGRGYDPVPPPKHDHVTRPDRLRPSLEN